MKTRKLTTGFYVPTDSFKSIPEHIAVMDESDRTLVALTGPADEDSDHVAESQQYAVLFSAAPELLEVLGILVEQGFYPHASTLDAAKRAIAKATQVS